MFILIVSGLSGSGKSTALNVLEDIGFFCIDNLPPQLITTFLKLCEKSYKNIQKIALGIDIREGEFLNKIYEEVKSVKKESNTVEFLFLEASSEILIKRYKETRRKHPLAPSGNITKGIQKEIQSLKKIKAQSKDIIDTSKLNIHQLKQIITDLYGKESGNYLIVTFTSFGYKHGIPYDADIMLDIRFLPNPQFVPMLKNYNGKNDKIKKFVLNNDESIIFLNKLVDFLEYLFDKYFKEGKSYLNVAIGCTGGRHRSVAIVEELQKRFKHLKPTVIHRDIDKN